METIRSRWVVLSGALFGVLALALSLFGMRSVGAYGIGGFSRTAIGLLNLTLYLVPLLVLLLGINSMATEREEGPLEVLLAQPIARSSVVPGKFCGLAAALAAALLGGFGVAGPGNRQRRGDTPAGTQLGDAALVGYGAALRSVIAACTSIERGAGPHPVTPRGHPRDSPSPNLGEGDGG